MQKVRIIRKGTEESGTWCFEVEDGQGSKYIIDNCHRTNHPDLGLNIECYHGTAHFDNSDKIVILRIYNDGHAEIEIKE